MAQLIDNAFSSYELTDQEMTEGSILTITQKQVIQNQVAMFAEQQLALRYDPNNPILFAQEQAEKKGGIEALQWLLTISESAEEAKAYVEHQDLRENTTLSEASNTQQINSIFQNLPAVKPVLNDKQPKT